MTQGTDGLPPNSDAQLLGGMRRPSAEYLAGRQMYQSRLGLLVDERDARNHSCCSIKMEVMDVAIMYVMRTINTLGLKCGSPRGPSCSHSFSIGKRI